ncbi:DUF3618 domain-containing protein [Streptomyces sp. NPDC055287]
MTDKAKGDGSSPTPDQLRAQVEKTREELGRTVEALAAKADVKAQAQQKAAKVKGLVHDKAASANEQLSGTAHVLGRKMHPRSVEPGAHTKGGAHTNRNLLVLAGLAAIAVIVVATRRSGRCW